MSLSNIIFFSENLKAMNLGGTSVVSMQICYSDERYRTIMVLLCKQSDLALHCLLADYFDMLCGI